MFSFKAKCHGVHIRKEPQNVFIVYNEEVLNCLLSSEARSQIVMGRKVSGTDVKALI